MPIYEYECESCGKVVEHWQKISDPPLEACDGCGGRMHKLISQSSFQLKGSGWYVTDYARKGEGKQEKKDKKEGGSSSSSGNPSGSKED